jgi:flavin-dependent dehydrogenase
MVLGPIHRFDALIVGGGPAGAAAAIHCARAGLRSLVVAADLGREPRSGDIAPSESVHPGIEKLLRQLDVGDLLQSVSRGVYRGIWVGDTYTPLGEDEEGAWCGRHIDRPGFDKGLHARAERAGVRLERARVVSTATEGREVRVRTAQGNSFAARFVIDASGARRIVASCMGIRARVLSGPLVVRSGVTTGDREPWAREDPVFIPRPDGWTWRAPERDGRWTWTQLSSGSDDSARRRQDEKWVGPGVRVASARWSLSAPIATGNLLMAGDAAGLLDPGAGQGLLFALWSGMMAAHTVVRSLEEPRGQRDFLGQYDQWFRARYEARAERLRHRYEELRIQV